MYGYRDQIFLRREEELRGFQFVRGTLVYFQKIHHLYLEARKAYLTFRKTVLRIQEWPRHPVAHHVTHLQSGLGNVQRPKEEKNFPVHSQMCVDQAKQSENYLI